MRLSSGIISWSKNEMAGTVTILTLRDEVRWTALADRMPSRDLTHYPRYCRVYERKGDGFAECFVYEADGGRVLYPFIRRPIAASPVGGLHDIVTPYCYGGFIHDATTPEEACRLIEDFRREFGRYCRDTGIVSEFVRFHPMLQNQRFSGDAFDRIILHQNNVVIDLSRTDEQLLSQCRPSYQQCIAKGRSAGLRLHLDEDQRLIDRFAALYGDTMLHHKQTGYLNLPPSYFHHLFDNVRGDLLLFAVYYEDRVIAASIFHRFEDRLDYFLSASDRSFLHLHANHFMISEVTSWAKRSGFGHIHLGGGRDSLTFFKRGFSRQVVPFHIAHRVHNPEAYEALTQARRSVPPWLPNAPSRFFPAYREGLE
jgi:hypothetical protein